MRIRLTRTLNAKKGWVEGAQLDWIRPVITELSRQIGDSDWYEVCASETRSLARRSGSPGLIPRIQKRKVTETVEA
mgnify:CR=1 FL=1